MKTALASAFAPAVTWMVKLAVLGVASVSKSQVSEMATHPGAQVEAFRSRPLDAGPYTFVWSGALTIKIREGGRTVNLHALDAAVRVEQAGAAQERGVTPMASAAAAIA